MDQADFHCITRLVDPDNGNLTTKTKMYLPTLTVKDFGYNVKKMLAEFKNLKTHVADLGGYFANDDQFMDLWACVRTMWEKEFAQFVRQLEDQDSAKDKPTRLSINDVIRQIADKQTQMETTEEWNVMLEKDTMVLAGKLEKKPALQTKSNSKSKNEGTGTVLMT